MAETTAKIEKILGVRSKPNQFGDYFYYKLQMDNGDVGEIGNSKKDAYTVGESLTYTKEEGRYGANFKTGAKGRGRGGFGGGGGGGFSAPPADKREVALHRATEVVCAMITAKMIPGDANSKHAGKSIIDLAETFHVWLENRP